MKISISLIAALAASYFLFPGVRAAAEDPELGALLVIWLLGAAAFFAMASYGFVCPQRHDENKKRETDRSHKANA